jgi:hypothetical protein
MIRIIAIIFVLLLPAWLAAQHRIGGQIVLPNAIPICNVLVELRDANQQTIAMDLSETDGTFLFEDVPAGTGYHLAFSREGTLLQGLSTMDVLLMAYHILGHGTLPYMAWAGDVNNSATVTTLDMITTRKAILGIPLDANLPVWVFDDPDVFVAPDNRIDLPTLEADLDVPVIGVKRGDVNHTAVLGCQ